MTLYTDFDAIKLSMTNFAQSFFLFYDEHNFLAPQNINVVNKLSMLIDIFFLEWGWLKNICKDQEDQLFYSVFHKMSHIWTTRSRNNINKNK